jgi:serine/threonine protein kinase
VKVCDFGLSQLFEKGTKLQDEKRPKGYFSIAIIGNSKKKKKSKNYRSRRTPLYMAPEVWLGKQFNEKADVLTHSLSLLSPLSSYIHICTKI